MIRFPCPICNGEAHPCPNCGCLVPLVPADKAELARLRADLEEARAENEALRDTERLKRQAEGRASMRAELDRLLRFEKAGLGHEDTFILSYTCPRCREDGGACPEHAPLHVAAQIAWEAVVAESRAAKCVACQNGVCSTHRPKKEPDRG